MDWQIDTWAGRVTVYSDKLPPDAGFEIVGFSDEQSALLAAQQLCDTLNRIAEPLEVC